tara:strand:- start:481 stop:2049 length:1569 start_codon:yes stop_codon:yes gene_type:complete
MSKDKLVKIKTALVSVSDKTGLNTLIKYLDKNNIRIISTGGTAKYIEGLGIEVNQVSDLTNFPEIMNGRIKTLNPLIYGGILNRPVIDDEIQGELGIKNIDLIIVNLYPFEKTIGGDNVNEEDAIENIDIGGPSMIRASAKNFYSKTVITDPNDYQSLMEELKKNNHSISYLMRKRLALKAFNLTALYDSNIQSYFLNSLQDNELPENLFLGLSKKDDLRYGENPHQKAGLYSFNDLDNASLVNANIFQGKALSYNNLLDANTAMRCSQEFEEPCCVIVKHVNPCGVALSKNIHEAYKKAFETDPESAFGGVIAVNRIVDKDFAEYLISNQFLEVIIAPSYNEDAIELFKEKENIRVISVEDYQKNQIDFQIQAIDGGFLIQEDDNKIVENNSLNVVTNREPDQKQLEDLIFSWKVAKYVKSNAIVFAKNLQTIGIGAGQMSRVNSAKIASLKATASNLKTTGAVMASDGFFPFSDSIKMASENEIECIIQPGGSIKDQEVIEEANKENISMIFTGIRHFRH